jgi:ATP-binding cassette subfamily F protein uup
MASYLQIENISKSYGPKVLFEKIGFNINEGDKIALIAPNGTGKTSLLRILAGKDKSDSGGKILFLKDIRIAFLEQEYSFDPDATLFGQIVSDSRPWMEHLDPEHRADYEQRIRQLLTSFGLRDFSKKMGDLSGGEVKRAAIVVMLASEADFFIMDEPTNHLDIDAIEYLENYLSHARCTLLMVTHDRYFLDAVCNTVMEMDRGAVYIYKGGYLNYLEKRQERIDNYNAETDKVRNLLRRELEWMRSTPSARTGKAKSRKNAFYDLKDRAEQVYRTDQVSLSEVGGASRLGTKIINCKDLSFSWDGVCYLKDFTYNFQRYEKVGIVGPNGCGKTTFLNILTGDVCQGTAMGTNRRPSSHPASLRDLSAAAECGSCHAVPSALSDVESCGGLSSGSVQGDFCLTGTIEWGESLKIGYYRQEGMSFDEGQTVLETVNDRHLLGRFLFSHDMLNNRIANLSGGEKRRLYLLTILMQQPNLLVMDEPTNDLDIVTLNVLEEYLKDFKGTLILVSHDRHFLDRLVDHLFVFTGDGHVKDFIGSYSEYRSFLKEAQADRRARSRDAAREERRARVANSPSETEPRPRRLSYKEQREFEQLEKDIAALSAEKAELEARLNGNPDEIPDFAEIQKLTNRYAALSSELDEKETRWLELSL